MIARVLPQSEWPRLAGTEAETLWPSLNPDTAKIMVVEEDGRIIATWTLVSMLHAECLWIDPERRGSFGVTRRLLSEMGKQVNALGSDAVLTGSVSKHVTDLIGRLGGTKLQGEMFVLPVGRFGKIRAEIEQCQQP